MSKRYFVILAVISFSGLFSSCISGIDSIQNSPDVDLNFCPSIVPVDVDTKSSGNGLGEVSIAPFKAYEEGGSQFVTLHYSSINTIETVGTGMQRVPTTKGYLHNLTGADANLHDYINSFKVSSWNTVTTDSFIEADTEVSYSDDKWSTAESYQMSGDDSFIFYAYANSGSPDYFDLSSTINSQVLQYTVPSSPADQYDILLGDYEGNTKPEGQSMPTGKVPVKFAHPLTSVVFKLGSIEKVDYVKSITITGVYSSGTVTHTSGRSFDWGTTRTGTTSTSQSDNAGLSVDSDTGYIGDPFVLIPQNLSDNPVKFTIEVYTTEGKDMTLVASRNIEDWQAGKCNVYTIQEDAYSVEICGNLSSGITFKNTSGTSEFIRVALVGNFYDDTENIVAPWDGTITPATGWTKRDDGFYYYQSPIASSSQTNPIVSSFEKPSREGSTFKLIVMVQATHFPF